MSNARSCRKSALLAIGLSLAVQSAGFAQAGRERAYEKHIEKIRRSLPPHSALPPVVDLTKPNTQRKGAGQLWERRFTGSTLSQDIRDPGVAPPVGQTSTSVITVEYGTAIWALPARSCDAVIIGIPVSASAHLAYNRRFVYSTFLVNVARVLKGKARSGVRKGDSVRVAQRGGNVRFPSGHLETFLWAGEGFMEPHKEYLLFIWKPIRSDSTYMVAEAYLNQGGLVFPVDVSGGGQSAYAGANFATFEAKVRAAIRDDADTN